MCDMLMRKRALRIVWLLLSLFTFSSAWAREVSITILDTTDLHGHIEPYRERGNTNAMGGLARCAAVIREVRAKEKNVLLVDAGDTIQGTAASWLTGGQMMMRAMNALRYDAWVLGNHEFDWGLEKLTGCVARAAMPVLAANVSGMAKVQPYLIREVDGVKVAVIGLTTTGVPNWSRPRLIPGLKFADSVETLRRVLPAARREGAQVMVLVVHQGYKEGGDDHANQIRAMAQRFSELDVIIGGHTHREFGGARIFGVVYNQAEFHGRRLGRVDLVYDTEQKRVTSRQARTIPMDASVAPDEELMGVVREDLERERKYLGEVIGEAAEPLLTKGGPKRETPIHGLICEAIAEGLKSRGAKVDAVVHGILSGREGLEKGPVTVGDVWRIVPYENTVGVAEMTGAQLWEVLDENVGAYEKSEFRGIWGLRWKFDPRGIPGRRVLEVRWPDGRLLGDAERVAVAFNSYELASGGLRWPKLREIVDKTESKLVEFELGTREALIDLIRGRGTITPSVQGWWEAEDSRRRGRLPTAY
jgi:2',3'-cyclic-nucleotide 2'-phosphodiesterase (5'-nucleotidase family)